MPACKKCGKEFKIRFRSNEKFCSQECCKAFHGIKEKKELFCVVCGVKLRGKSKKYCSESCARKAAILRNMKQMKESSELKGTSRAPKIIKRKRKPKYTLAQINDMARAEGLNYGQYVAKYGL